MAAALVLVVVFRCIVTASLSSCLQIQLDKQLKRASESYLGCCFLEHLHHWQVLNKWWWWRWCWWWCKKSSQCNLIQFGSLCRCLWCWNFKEHLKVFGPQQLRDMEEVFDVFFSDDFKDLVFWFHMLVTVLPVTVLEPENLNLIKGEKNVCRNIRPEPLQAWCTVTLQHSSRIPEISAFSFFSASFVV